MGKKSRRQRGDKRAHLNPTERSLKQYLDAKDKEKEEEEAMNNEPAPWICTKTNQPFAPGAAPHERRAAAIAAAEAECRAAIAADPGAADIVAVRPADARRVERVETAIQDLMDAVILDDDDDNNLTEYLRKSGTVTRVSSRELIKLIKRWPRLRKYWPRIRRRICSGCGKQYDLSEPRLWVCAGCGEARYCDESCQRAHWPDHQGVCCGPLIKAGNDPYRYR